MCRLSQVLWTPTSEFAPAFTSTVELGRYGRPEEIAAAVAFLVRPDSTYVTGTVLNVDGG